MTPGRLKHLKSTSVELRRLFERAIAIREIAEPFRSFDADRDVAPIRTFMDDRNFDVVGIREEGRLTGYVHRQNLSGGPARNYVISFRTEDTLSENEPLLSAIEALRSRPHLFITVLGEVGGIVTKGDLQKAPVRLWLFGMISLIEMQMLRLLRQRLPEGAWEDLLTPARLDAAHKIFNERRRRNEEAHVSDFSDCLQICDKATIFLKHDELAGIASFPSRAAGQRFFSFLEALRNDLAHSNDILRGRWPELAERVVEGESLLRRLEAVQ